MKGHTKLMAALAAFSLCLTVEAQELRTEVFEILNLDYPGLETVKALHSQGDDAAAAAALLAYYRERTCVKAPEFPNLATKKVHISKTQQQWADEALNHQFYVHDGYQPSYNYGEDIDWTYWPVHDNELRWQLHRHKWFTPMGQAYRVSGDEKYAKEWVFQYMDWIKKNPLVKLTKTERLMASDSLKALEENSGFAWRGLEVSHRLQDQVSQFALFLPAESFTPEFLTEFLVNYHKHAAYLIDHYSKTGNHLLFQAQRMICAGTYFREFTDASAWVDSGVSILNDQIKEQVYDDGGQYELCPHYHLAAIQIFCKSLEIADLTGMRDVFPKSFADALEKMMEFYLNIIYPDYDNPYFSDARSTKKATLLNQLKTWTALYPDNQLIKYFATEGAEGCPPDYKSKGFETSGFFVFRNGWGEDATQMVVKAGPPAFWHCQPDNGTIELWYKGTRLLTDSGSYVYGGDEEVLAERNWFRQTAVHNTLTLGYKDLETTDSKTRLWQPEGDVQILVTENQSYKNLKHRRSIFYVDESYFVIVDEAVGDARGVVNLNWQMPRGGQIDNSREDMHFATLFEESTNMKLQTFGPEGMTLKKEEGWISPNYRKKQKRMHISFNARKDTSSPVRFITVIVPHDEPTNEPTISAKFVSQTYSEYGLRIQVKVGKSKKTLEYTLD